MSEGKKKPPLAEAREIAESILPHWKGVGDLRSPQRNEIAIAEIAAALLKIMEHLEEREKNA